MEINLRAMICVRVDCFLLTTQTYPNSKAAKIEYTVLHLAQRADIIIHPARLALRLQLNSRLPTLAPLLHSYNKSWLASRDGQTARLNLIRERNIQRRWRSLAARLIGNYVTSRSFATTTCFPRKERRDSPCFPTVRSFVAPPPSALCVASCRRELLRT